MTTTTKNPNLDAFEFGIGEDLEIKRTTRRCAGNGTRVIGTVAGHRFDALVFPEHAESEEYEIGRSKISKLWIKRLADNTTVYNWDRGSDVEPRTDLAAAIVKFLAEGLADFIYGA